MQRLHKNRSDIEIFENLDNLQKVKAAYIKAIELVKNEEKIVEIKGDQTVDALSKAIWEEVKNLFVI